VVECDEHGCTASAVYRGRCVTHHCEYVEALVLDTIARYSLFTKDDKLCVAVSGGKDSQVVLHILHMAGYNVSALLIDEGISGYREPTTQDMIDFCVERNIVLRQVSFNKDIGTTLDAVSKQLQAPPCSACGAWRRQLLNRHAADFDYVVTGHNLDDEAQSYMMNLVLGRLEQSLRTGIKTAGNGFVPRVKPLYFLSEKDIRLYTLVKGFSVQEDDCPYAHQSLRFTVRDALNMLEEKQPGTKRAIVDRFVDMSMDVASLEKKFCSSCGQPSLRNPCMACGLRIQLVPS